MTSALEETAGVKGSLVSLSEMASSMFSKESGFKKQGGEQLKKTVDINF